MNDKATRKKGKKLFFYVLYAYLLRKYEKSNKNYYN